MELLNIPCLTDTQIIALIECAEQTALRFCAPVYLVGSAVSKLYPNDIDLYVAVKGDSYIRLFANYNRKTEAKDSHGCHTENIKAMQIQQAKIIRKQKEYFESKIKGWDFDIKFQIIETFVQHKGERIRLDRIYEGLW